MLIHSGRSPNSLKVHIALEEMQVTYEYRLHSIGTAALEGDHFRPINPNAKVPVLVDGDVVVYESGAILLYLAGRYGQLTPEGTLVAKMHQFMFLEASAVLPVLGGYGLAGELARGEQCSRDRVDGLSRELLRLVGVLEYELGRSDGPYLCGAYSLADIQLYAPLQKGAQFGLVPTAGRVGEWLALIEQRPAVQAAFAKIERPASS